MYGRCFFKEAVCGTTLAELHEQDLLAMGVEKLGHRKVIMQAIRGLFEEAEESGATHSVDGSGGVGGGGSGGGGLQQQAQAGAQEQELNGTVCRKKEG